MFKRQSDFELSILSKFERKQFFIEINIYKILINYI